MRRWVSDADERILSHDAVNSRVSDGVWRVWGALSLPSIACETVMCKKRSHAAGPFATRGRRWSLQK